MAHVRAEMASRRTSRCLRRGHIVFVSRAMLRHATRSMTECLRRGRIIGRFGRSGEESLACAVGKFVGGQQAISQRMAEFSAFPSMAVTMWRLVE